VRCQSSAGSNPIGFPIFAVGLNSVHDSLGRRVIGSLPGVVSGGNPAHGVETAFLVAIQSKGGCQAFHNG
jgi:hypothetical protein